MASARRSYKLQLLKLQGCNFCDALRSLCVALAVLLARVAMQISQFRSCEDKIRKSGELL
jgi:hypothetical protein